MSDDKPIVTMSGWSHRSRRRPPRGRRPFHPARIGRGLASRRDGGRCRGGPERRVCRRSPSSGLVAAGLLAVLGRAELGVARHSCPCPRSSPSAWCWCRAGAGVAGPGAHPTTCTWSLACSWRWPWWVPASCRRGGSSPRSTRSGWDGWPGWPLPTSRVAAGLARRGCGHHRGSSHGQRQPTAAGRAARRAGSDSAAQASVRDPLTGLVNRQGLSMMGQQIVETARRSGDAVHCVYIDIDQLRHVNEVAGEEDRATTSWSRSSDALRSITRGTDIVARWGGDEFCVIGPGPGMSPDGARTTAARARPAEPSGRRRRLGAQGLRRVERCWRRGTAARSTPCWARPTRRCTCVVPCGAVASVSQGSVVERRVAQRTSSIVLRASLDEVWLTGSIRCRHRRLDSLTGEAGGLQPRV